MNGIDTCRELRKRSIVPIVLVGESAPPDAIVQALEIGADDFFAKTVKKREMAVRLEAVLRRSQPWETGVFRAGDLVLNAQTREVTVNDRVVDLRPKEYELLHYLITHRQETLSKSHLSAQVWGRKKYSSTAVEMAIRRLREKIEPDPSRPQHLVTLRGCGYVLA